MNRSAELLRIIQGISGKLQSLKEDEINRLNINDLSLTGFRYLQGIHAVGNPTFVQLARWLNVSKPTVTIMVNRLIESGFVEKHRSAEDGRMYCLNLTGRGRSVVAAHEAVQVEFVRQMTELFDEDELQLLIDLLGRV